MNLESKITSALKDAMRNKDQDSLVALRAIKSAIILHKTQRSSSDKLSKEDEMKILQKLVKQRKESADIYLKQNRNDLAEPELSEAKVIKQFLPKSLSEDQVKEIVKSIVDEIRAEGMKDMGKVMGLSTKKLMGRADGKMISTIVREFLS
ncbi:MAG: glutamyl-tRNA amidotransferase [Flavobacteriaceae bacterium]|mgnify:CR=1 FL=1|nr:glutamyl-tRNA amidotransferase [Flavobacteriaceae bacterium]